MKGCPFYLVQDRTETNLVNLRRTIYLTIMSSMGFEEGGHKLMKIDLAPGQEIEVVTMLIECCSQEKTYLRRCTLSCLITGSPGFLRGLLHIPRYLQVLRPAGAALLRSSLDVAESV